MDVMYCLFVQHGGMWSCQSCDSRWPVRSERTPRRICGKPKEPARCAHIGQPIGTEQCQSCQGTVKIKVFACDVHGKCTLAKKLDGISVCAGCGDYQPSNRDPDPDSGVAG